MKKLYLLSLLVCTLLTTAFAQKRLVLIEEFTNTGCGPCAQWSPILDSCINYRLGDCIAIKYHSGYPYADDEFYNYDKEVQQAKVDFYHVTGVPTTYVNGTELGERSYAFLNKAIDYCMEQPSDFQIALEKQLEGNHLSTKVGVARNIELSTEYTTSIPEIDVSNLRLFVAAIEEHIEAATPYPNGEKELNYTMRKMLTPAEGITPSSSIIFNAGFEWDIDFFDDLKQLGVLAYLQNIDTHEILATAYKGPDAEGENRVALMNLYDTPDNICTPDYYGKVLFRNNGANTITSATLNVRVNNVEKYYPWTGELNYLDRAVMEFDGFNGFELSADGKNEVMVWLSNINGSDAESNVRESSFSNSVEAAYGVQLKLYTDKKPEEITWKLYDSAGNIVTEGGPYNDQPRKFITVDFELTHDDCYHLEFHDAGGDGIKGAAGNGYYQLFQFDESGKTKRILQGDYDGAYYDVFFHLTGTPPPPHRLVLFEEFTNTSCDPCSEFSPYLDKTIYDRMGDMVAITYHWNFPSAQDPFYLANAEDAMTRAAFYGITGVPSLWVNGVHAGAWGYEEYLDAYVDGAGAVAAKMNIDTEATLVADDSPSGALKVNVSLSPMGITNGENLRLFVAAVEERVEWSEPAANGERSWNYVMRKLLPSADGQPLEAELTQVAPYQYEYTWPIQNMTDPNELGIVTFVQDITTKQVIGAAYTPRPTGYDQAAKILEVKDLPDRICTPEFSCALVVRNTGKEPLTSAVLNVRINGSVQQTPWTGSLEPLAITTLRIPLFTDFTLNGSQANDVELWLSDLNGNSEAESVHKQYAVANAVSARNAVRLTIMTDQHPEETTWAVLNSAGDVVCQGGPYTEARRKQVIDLPLDTDDCYLLEFEDSGNDGISEGRGYYMLHEVGADGKTRLMVQATYSEALHDVFFSLSNAATSGIQYVAMPSQQTAQPAYDLNGRKATATTKGIVIKNDKKVINK
ncbi:MAG: hypothetical protein IJ200_07330 [Prevotella sp.]|nr:hypothetical protein [Prevotella sp.]